MGAAMQDLMGSSLAVSGERCDRTCLLYISTHPQPDRMI